MFLNILLGTNIKRIREFRGLTQEFVADKISITQQAYSRWENNECDIPSSRLIKLAEILNVSVEEIVGLNDSTFTFNNYNSQQITGYQNIDNGLSEREKSLYESQISEYKTMIDFLKTQVQLLQQQVFFSANES